MIQEKDIFGAVISTLRAGFDARVPDLKVVVKQWYAPRIVGGIPAGQIGVLLTSVSNTRFGFLGRQDAWDDVKLQETHTETQATQKVIQCTAQYKPMPAPTPLLPYTANDICFMASAILQSDAGRSALRTAGFGIERIGEIRSPTFVDDADQFSQVPSFDFTLDFNQVEKTVSPYVTATELDIYRV